MIGPKKVMSKKGWSAETELYQIFIQIALGMVIAGYIYVLHRDGFTWNSPKYLYYWESL